MSDNQRGAFYMMTAMFAFLVNDGLMKSMAGAMTSVQALGMRSAIAAVILLPILLSRGIKIRGFSARDKRQIFFRSLAETCSSMVYITALFLIPLADATAILQVLPLTITLAGAVFLGERPGWRRMAAILVGLVGVLLILRPGGQGFQPGALLALASVAMVTTREIVTRTLSKDVPSLSVTFYTVVCASLICFATIPWLEWRSLDAWTTAKLLMTTVAVIIGYYFSVLSIRTGELAAVGPFRYSGLVFALIIGFVVFGEIPQALTLLGAAIVAGTGLFTLWRERSVRPKGQDT